MAHNMYRHDDSHEDVRCAAIWVNDPNDSCIHQPVNIDTGYVICGLRHHNCVMNMKTGWKKYKHVQGFLTSKDRFVTREEAVDIALAAKQIPERVTRLFSEDLY